MNELINKNNRRSFLRKSMLLGTGAWLSMPEVLKATTRVASKSGTVENFTFLFQGDSITDGNRSRNMDWNHVMGHGYAYIIASKLWYEFPDKRFHFFNRGISGNKITDLAARWDEDTLALKPDLLSILVGINDVGTLIRGDTNFTAEQFEEKYRALLQRTKNDLPRVQLVICEPFILPVGKVKDNLDLYDREVKKRQEVTRKLAAEFDAIYIPFQDSFNKALKKAPADYWIWDGIHPMPAGHELMALEWIKQVSKKLKFIA